MSCEKIRISHVGHMKKSISGRVGHMKKSISGRVGHVKDYI